MALGQTLQRSCAAVQGQLTQNSQQILGATCAQVATVVQKQSSTPQCALHARAQDVVLGSAPCADFAGMLAVALESYSAQALCKVGIAVEGM